MKESLRQWTPLALSATALVVIFLVGPGLVTRLAYAAEAARIQAERDSLVEMSRQDTLSPLFRAVSRVVQPAVVEIRITRRVRMPEIDQEMEELLRRHFGENSPFGEPGSPMPEMPQEYFARGLGSGVVVDASEGYILTNYHVVAGAEEVAVILHDGRKIVAEWVRGDQQTDLAVVKIEADELIDAPLGDSDTLEVGDWVLAIGSPRGLQRTVTAGIVSAKGRHINGPGMYEDTIQTDAAINRGNSGGPLVNMRGEVIGINNAIASSSGGNEGIGFAISSNMAADVMEQLIANGSVVRGFMGVMIQDVDDRLAASFDLPSTDGALISQVQPATPADRAGLEAGDFVVSVDGNPVRSVLELRRVIAGIQPGRTVPLEAYRNGEIVTFEVEIAAQPSSMSYANQPLPRPAANHGLKVATLSRRTASRLGYDEDLEGVVITEVSPVSEAADEGLRVGMVITHVGADPVTTAEAFGELLGAAENGEGVRLRVRTPQGARYVFVAPSQAPEEE